MQVWLQEKLSAIDWGTYYFFREQGKSLPAGIRHLLFGLNSLASWQMTTVLILVLVAVLASRRRYRPALGALLAFAAGIALIWNFREFMPSDRPPEAVDLVGGDQMMTSFPSASVLLFSLVVALWATTPEFLGAGRKARLTALAGAVVLIVLVILSQLFLKLHFLLDILAGLAAGLALALSVKALAHPSAPNSPEARA